MMVLTATKKILIADDEPRLRLLVRTALEREDCEILEAVDGRQALDLILSEKPDLVILDVIMPGLYGTEVCKQLKSNPETAHIPVIILTAYPQRFFNERADFWWTKPFSPIYLRDTVQRILAHSPQS
jgi:CheY-like chemotaxis protein